MSKMMKTKPRALASVGATARILVVEDNPITRKSVSLALKIAGYQVAEAENGRNALLQMQMLPDLVLLDLLLPDMHGSELVKQLRQLPGGLDIPMIAFSGFISKMVETRVADAGFTDFLLKPVEPSRLVNTVASYLMQRTPGASTPGAGRRLLLADDDPVQLKLLRLQFEHAGFEVETALHGADALTAALRKRPDMIVTDVLMPHMDGFDLCLAVRKEPRLCHVPVVMVTANYAEAADRMMGERVGVHAFIYRDAGFDTLLKAVMANLEKPAPVVNLNMQDIPAERHNQIVRQLERQVKLRTACTQRNLVQSAILRELSQIAEILANREDLESALDEILAYCLDGAGLSKGVLYLAQTNAALAFSAHYGCSDTLEIARDFFGIPHIFQRALQSGETLMIPSAEVSVTQGEKLLRQAQAKSALIIPVRSGDADVAVLLLLSLHRDLLEDDWLAFGRALASQISQSVALSRAFFRLAESEQRYRLLFEAANEGICITDDDGRVMDANPAACTLAGYPLEQFRGMNIGQILTGKERAQWLAIQHEYQRSGILHGEFTYAMRNTNVRTVEVHGTRVQPGIYLNIMLDITERRRTEQTIHKLAYRDTLTGLPNRVALRERLSQGLREAKARGQTLAMLLLNLNNFREINDTLGHANGDQVLTQVATRLQNILWESDMVARMTADEFAVLLPRLANRSHIELVVDKIAQGFKAPFLLADLPIDVQSSIGIALYPEHGVDTDALFQHADIALHAAKDAHLPHAIYEPEKHRTDARQLTLIAELREAIHANHLVLYYQPKIALQTGHIIGMEALVRWPHATRGMIFPDNFIPMAERTGLINPLTTWVLGNALRQTRLWRKAGQDFSVAVNLSVRNLQQSDIVTEIQDLVNGSGVPPAALTLEITESAIMVDPGRAHTILGELRDFGVRISIDDFGIGHSSLAYLKQLPAHQLKIDKSFIMDFTDKGNAAIVRSTIELAHNLGLEVIAEGVEDEFTLVALKELNCDVAQGYHIARPLPVSDLAVWLELWLARLTAAE